MERGAPAGAEEAGEELRALLQLTVLRPSNLPVIQSANALIDLIGPCRGPFEKRITATDLRRDQNRLILPKNHVRMFVIPLLERGVDLAQGVGVTTFNAEGEEFTLQFKLWSGKKYVLMGGWNRFVEANPLGRSSILKIWAFRNVRTEGLCFVISAVRRQ